MITKLKENFLLRLFFYHLLKRNDTSRKIKGIDKRLHFNAGTNLNLFFQKEIIIEPVITNNLRKLIQNDFIIYDIGANIGYYTVLFSQLSIKGKIIAFEPDSFNYEYLKKNKKLNDLSNVSLIFNGISSTISELLFYKDINTGRTSSVEQDAWHPNATKIQKVIISTTTLDKVCETYGKPNLIKCDVEGHEVEVLKGAEKVLSYNPILMIEVKDSNRKEVTQILSYYHYDFFNAEIPLVHSTIPSIKIDFPNVLCIKKGFTLDILNDKNMI
jgi:FkbM family methyltransferase